MQTMQAQGCTPSGNDHDVPPRSPQRPFETVADDLRRRIAAGEWQPDEALPTNKDLAGHYGVSEATITRAMRRLAAEGLVVTVPRWGTFRSAGP
jgi:DNA-binding GntR family transcriptional regulator